MEILGLAVGTIVHLYAERLNRVAKLNLFLCVCLLHAYIGFNSIYRQTKYSLGTK